MPVADREEVKEVTVPAATTRAVPVETDISFPPGRVVQVEVVIPPGPAGLSGFQLTNSKQQALPYNTGAFFIGDSETIRRELTGYNNSGRWGFRAYNEDVNAHTFQIRFSVVENDVAEAAPTAAEPLQTTPSGAVETGSGAPTGGTEPGEPTEPTPSPEGGTEAPVGAPGEGEAPKIEPPAGEGEGAPGEGEPAPVGEPPLGTFGTGEGEGSEGEPAPVGLPGGEAIPGEAGESEVPEVAGEEPQPITGSGKTTAGARVITTVKVVKLPAGGWLPAGARFTRERTDQGQDLITNWQGAITAPGDGEVIHNLSDKAFPVGFGPHYAVVRITTGPFAGHEWYIGHCTSVVNAGEKFKAGRVLAHADQGHREGGGWAEIGEAINGQPGPMGNGAKWAHLFGTVTRRVVSKHTVAPPKKRPAPKRKPPAKGKKPGKPTHKAPAPKHAHAAPKRAPAAHGSPKPAGRAPARSSARAAPRPAAPPRRAPAPPRAAPRPAPRAAPRPAPRPAPPRAAPRPAPAPPRRRK